MVLSKYNSNEWMLTEQDEAVQLLVWEQFHLFQSTNFKMKISRFACLYSIINTIPSCIFFGQWLGFVKLKTKCNSALCFFRLFSILGLDGYHDVSSDSCLAVTLVD